MMPLAFLTRLGVAIAVVPGCCEVSSLGWGASHGAKSWLVVSGLPADAATLGTVRDALTPSECDSLCAHAGRETVLGCYFADAAPVGALDPPFYRCKSTTGDELRPASAAEAERARTTIDYPGMDACHTICAAPGRDVTGCELDWRPLLSAVAPGQRLLVCELHTPGGCGEKALSRR
jgi:hypothetical protein